MPLQPRRVKIPRHLPEAWTVDEVRRLLAACKTIRRHGLYLEGCIRLIWDTGIRYADARSFDMRSVDFEGRDVVYQSKTTEPLQIELDSRTMDVLRQLGGTHPLRYGKLRQTYIWWDKLCRTAGVPHGGPQRIRRSAATELERVRPGAATAFLGHRSADLAMRHYLDPRILNRNRPKPTRL
jgi:integrase